jgi:hypothetical protein
MSISVNIPLTQSNMFFWMLQASAESLFVRAFYTAFLFFFSFRLLVPFPISRSSVVLLRLLLLFVCLFFLFQQGSKNVPFVDLCSKVFESKLPRNMIDQLDYSLASPKVIYMDGLESDRVTHEQERSVHSFFLRSLWCPRF